jgi:hypothetical protein
MDGNGRLRHHTTAFLAATTIGIAALGAPGVATAAPPPAPGVRTLSTQPVGFEANRGQAPEGVDFVARLGPYRLRLEGGEAVLDLRTIERPSLRSRLSTSARTLAAMAPRLTGAQVRMRLVGADAAARS